MYKTLKSRVLRWWSFNSPVTASWDGWEDFKTEFKAKAPIRFFLSETLPRSIAPTLGRINRMRMWVRFRMVRYDKIDSGLGPGYYDKDTLLLHSAFNLLKDYVEIEQAWMHLICSKDSRKITWYENYVPFYSHYFFRSREYGLEHLKWECNLDNSSEEVHEWEIEANAHQAAAAREVRELYLWWVDAYLIRKEIEYPAEAEVLDGNGLSWMSERFRAAHPVEDKILKQYSKDVQEQEERWEKEDTEMLVRLAKARGSLWT